MTTTAAIFVSTILNKKIPIGSDPNAVVGRVRFVRYDINSDNTVTTYSGNYLNIPAQFPTTFGTSGQTIALASNGKVF